MPSNKNAIIRYRTLDRCLRNTGRRYYLSDLLSACSAALSEFSGKPQQVSRCTSRSGIGGGARIVWR